MAYGYQPYYTPYQPYQPPMPDQLAQLRAGQYQPLQNMQQPPQQQNNTQIVWVPGGRRHSSTRWPQTVPLPCGQHRT